MDRYWLLTSTFYGNWLPGDPRGFVGKMRDGSGAHVTHNVPGTPYDADLPRLARFAADRLKCLPIKLDAAQAEVLLAQFQETANYRKWLLLAVAVMTNHAHLVVGVPGDPDPSDVLGDFKSYGSRALNRRWARPASGTWWTESGSKRKLGGEAEVLAAVRYVREQEFPLVVWISEKLSLRPGG
ncbi:MAG TPA: transposase [Pirellulales bacterium]|nr:transposase [Pirellulales bacterium]